MYFKKNKTCKFDKGFIRLLYKKLGCRNLPYPEFIKNRSSTGYNSSVVAYDFIIDKLSINTEKVLKSAKKYLFSLKYSEQETTAKQALIDGGLNNFKCVNGKRINKKQLDKIIEMCQIGYSTISIENYLITEKILSK